MAQCLLVAQARAAPSQPLFKRACPLITLRIGVYADPGYQSSGLYAQYERLHPDIRIVQSDTAAQASYWPALQGELRSGHGLDDIQAVPVADIAAVTGPLAGDFVPLNTLAGVPGGTSAFADGWLPWVARQAMNRPGLKGSVTHGHGGGSSRSSSASPAQVADPAPGYAPCRPAGPAGGPFPAYRAGLRLRPNLEALSARTRRAPTRLPGPPCPLRQPDPRGGCGCEG